MSFRSKDQKERWIKDQERKARSAAIDEEKEQAKFEVKKYGRKLTPEERNTVANGGEAMGSKEFKYGDAMEKMGARNAGDVFRALGMSIKRGESPSKKGRRYH